MSTKAGVEKEGECGRVREWRSERKEDGESGEVRERRMERVEE